MAFKAFVSSTFKDLQAHRAYVIKALREAGVHVDPMEDWPPDADEPKVFSTERMTGCDLCVLLVGFRRGCVPEGETRSITQMEYDAATGDPRVDILVFMLDEVAPWPRQFDEMDRDPQARTWREELARRGPGSFGLDPATIRIAPAVTRWMEKRRREMGSPAPAPSPERIRNIPVARNTAFVGREALLAGLREALEKDCRVVLSGLPGIGKTQIVLEYAYSHADEYDIVWWLRAEDVKTLMEDMAALAMRLAPDTRAEGIGERVGVARALLEQRGKWLLVFDNAADPAAVAEVMPGTTAGHVLISSWNPSWKVLGANVLDVPKLERVASIEFLVKRSNDGDRVAADALAAELGDLPLALDHAAAFVEASGSSLREYLDLYRERGPELRAKQMDPTVSDTVATTWEISIRSAARQSRPAAALLDFVAFVAPDAFPLAVFSRSMEGLPEDLRLLARDRLARLEALAVVRSYSLAKVENDSLSVHRLVQAVMRDRMDPGQRRKQMMLVVGSLSKAFPSNGPDDTVDASKLLPHLVAALEHVVRGEALQTTTPDPAVEQAGSPTALQEEVAPGETVPDKTAGAPFGAAMDQLIRADVAVVTNAATSLGDANDVRAPAGPPAAPAGAQTAGAAREATGPGGAATLAPANDKTVTEMLTRVSDVIAAYERFDRAGTAFDRVVTDREATELINASASVEKLGTIVRAHGDMAIARQAYERALDLLRRLGEDHPSAATVREDLRGLT